MRTTENLTANVEAVQEARSGHSREKWFAVISLVLVTASAVALLYPR